MKFLKSVIFLVLFFCFIQILAQIQRPNDRIEIFVPTPHNIKFAEYNSDEPSFYQQKDKWQQIIDSTWGAGLSLDKKLEIFNAYTNSISAKYPGFPNLDYDWDSLRSYYYNQIDSTTSRGKFAAIMSHIAFKLREHHSWAKDYEVITTPLNPGTPLLIVGGFNDVSHFGAVLTTLPDSTSLVLRVIKNHPLNLEPGDIILGYEGVPWKNLVEELLEAGLPIAGNSSGSKSAYLNSKLVSVGMNWHLFNTIDVKKYSTGEIQSLETSKLLSLSFHDTVMLNNEQLEIQNIPFPKYEPQYPEPGLNGGEVITSGILEDSNIGYVYLCHETTDADTKLKEAINSFAGTDGLIIDLRYNGGGGNELDNTMKLLFNSDTLTLEDAYRCSPDNWNICPAGNASDYKIMGDPNTFYEKPIAVLIGPACVSMGDFIAYKLKLHPNVKFFGKSSSGSLAFSAVINLYEWRLLHHISETCYASDPTTFLDQKEFPVDFPVWFSPDDVAKGYDTVVEEAKKYIENNTPPVDVEKGLTIPLEISLSQNYPNPFNPSTTIKYGVNVETFIRLNVFDVLGREVRTLVKQKQNPGNYEVEWNATIYPSGVYFYQLKVGEFREIKKMILLK